MESIDPVTQALQIFTSMEMICGAIILALLNVWLRRRDVRDWSLVWLCVSLLSWAIVGIVKYAYQQWLHTDATVVGYVISPISTVFLTMTAFRLARVRELFQANADLKRWPRNIIGTVILLSLAGLSLRLIAVLQSLPSVHKAAGYVDATASSLEIITLGLGLIYSFYTYGNQSLASLTGMDTLYRVAKQYILASGVKTGGAFAICNAASNSILVMLFISLAVAWGLSDASRLKPVGGTSHISVLAMFFDLRGSTQWADQIGRMGSNLDAVSKFMDELRKWAWDKATSLPDGRPDFVKFLGDGYLFIWEVAEQEAMTRRAESVMRLSCALNSDYASWVKEKGWQRNLGAVPESLGIGVDAGNAIRIIYENGSNDYLGAPVNNAAKLQDMARPSGGVVVRTEFFRRFQSENSPADFCARFTRSGMMQVGKGSLTPVHATEAVVFANGDALHEALAG